MTSLEDRGSRGDRTARLVVWTTWAVLFAAAIGFVVRFGCNIPYWDDWILVPVLAGEDSLTLSWLWSGSNSHRFPLAKLLLWCLARATDGDLRGGMVLSTIILGGVAALFIRCAASVRGSTRLQDAFFPLILLHWGHYHNLLWSINLHFVCTTAIFAILVTFMCRQSHDWSRSSIYVLIGCAVLLPLQSAPGLLMTPAVMAWLLYAGIRAGHGPRRRLLCATVVVMLVLGVWHGIGLSHSSCFTTPGVRDSLRTSLQFVATAVGPAGRWLWPVSGLLIAGVSAVTLVLPLVAWRTMPTERVRTAGLLAGIVAVGGVSLAIGVCRSGFGWTSGLSPRYVTVACPLLCVIYLTWLVFGGTRWSRWGPSVLCAGMLAVLPVNTGDGLDWAGNQYDVKQAFQSDLRAGVQPEELAERYWEFLGPQQEVLAESMKVMRRAGLGIYQK